MRHLACGWWKKSRETCMFQLITSSAATQKGSNPESFLLVCCSELSKFLVILRQFCVHIKGVLIFVGGFGGGGFFMGCVGLCKLIPWQAFLSCLLNLLAWLFPTVFSILWLLGFPNKCSYWMHLYWFFGSFLVVVVVVEILEALNIYSSLRNKVSSPMNSGV